MSRFCLQQKQKRSWQNLKVQTNKNKNVIYKKAGNLARPAFLIAHAFRGFITPNAEGATFIYRSHLWSANIRKARYSNVVK
jgi:hypothetical protein